jgi:hypothetical protein
MWCIPLKKQIMQCTSFIFAKRWDFGFAESIVLVESDGKMVGQSRVGRSVARFPVTFEGLLQAGLKCCDLSPSTKGNRK